MDSIETARLKLRQWKEGDFDNFARYYADEDNARYVGGKKDPDQAWRHMALQAGHWQLKGFGYWAVDEKEHQRFRWLCGSMAIARLAGARAWLLAPKGAPGKGLRTRGVPGVHRPCTRDSACQLIGELHRSTQCALDTVGEAVGCCVRRHDRVGELWASLCLSAFLGFSLDSLFFERRVRAPMYNASRHFSAAFPLAHEGASLPCVRSDVLARVGYMTS